MTQRIGSEAGPGYATAGGCVAFAIRTESQRAIVSPLRRYGVTALLPDIGRLSGYCGMVLSCSIGKTRGKLPIDPAEAAHPEARSQKGGQDPSVALTSARPGVR